MKRTLLSLLLTCSFAIQNLAIADTASLQQSINKGLEAISGMQSPDGSFTRLIIGSSIIYNTNVIFLYEFLNRTEEKAAIIQKLMGFIWKQQNTDGGFPGYPGGPSNLSISVQAYLSGKIAGEDENSSRMTVLEKYIRSHGGLSKATTALPYLMAFDIDTNGHCVSSLLESRLLSMDSSLPWIRVILYPLIHVYTSGRFHVLSAKKYPKRLGRSGFCARWTPSPLHPFHIGEKKFWNWMENHMNEDGTLFDYTPTTVPGLMALSLKPAKYDALVEKGLATLESFQMPLEDGTIYQSSGDAAVGETLVVVNALLEMGMSPDHPMLKKAQDFLWSMQQKTTGAFGMSKHNTHFPDSDDTSDALYALKRLAPDTPENRRKLDQGLDWLLSVQNSDGGFGTWEKNSNSRLSRMLTKRGGMVLSESVIEHSARAVLALSLFKDQSPRAALAYQRVLRFILNKQLPDGSYPGTWFVDYLFGSSMALAALATSPETPEVRAAIERAMQFILARQQPDGGFSESPDSYLLQRSVPLEKGSSPTQTGLVMSALLTFDRVDQHRHAAVLRPHLEKAAEFLVKTQKDDGLWHDPTWTGVTFPKVEYLIYQVVQEMMPIEALGMYRLMQPSP
jgi:squalene-hopene/tetraprenyl-beta-curcumene cyclase